MKWTDLKNKNTDEVKEILAEKKAALQSLRFAVSGGQLKQVKKINETRKTIAKLIMLLAQRDKEQK